MIAVGDKAPSFDGHDQAGKPLALADFAGKKNVVLYFYPRDFTPGCTKEACTFRDAYDELASADTEVVGVSTDDAESHAKFAAKHRLQFPLLADPDQKVGKAYGVIGGIRGGLFNQAARVTFVIDKQGVVRGVFKHEILVGRHLDDVRETLKKLG